MRAAVVTTLSLRRARPALRARLALQAHPASGPAPPQRPPGSRRAKKGLPLPAAPRERAAPASPLSPSPNPLLSFLSYLPRQLPSGRVGRDLGQEVDIVHGMELGQLGRVGAARALRERERKRMRKGTGRLEIEPLSISVNSHTPPSPRAARTPGLRNASWPAGAASWDGWRRSRRSRSRLNGKWREWKVESGRCEEWASALCVRSPTPGASHAPVHRCARSHSIYLSRSLWRDAAFARTVIEVGDAALAVNTYIK